jgi:hypothetical protein
MVYDANLQSCGPYTEPNKTMSRVPGSIDPAWNSLQILGDHALVITASASRRILQMSFVLLAATS